METKTGEQSKADQLAAAQVMAGWFGDFARGADETIGEIPDLARQRLERHFPGKKLEEALRLAGKMAITMPNKDNRADAFVLYCCGYPAAAIKILTGQIVKNDPPPPDSGAWIKPTPNIKPPAEHTLPTSYTEDGLPTDSDLPDQKPKPVQPIHKAASPAASKQPDSTKRKLRELLGIRPEDAAWMESALCAQTDPEAFFPEKGGSSRLAKRICKSCEVRVQCLDYALAHDERFGIWGGAVERERHELKNARKKAAESGA